MSHSSAHGIDRVIELDIPPDHTVDRTVVW